MLIPKAILGNSNDETNFLHELLLTNRFIVNLRKAFANYLSTDVKLSKSQLSKMMQSLCPLLKTGLPLMKNVLQLLAKSVLISLGLTAAASAGDSRIHKKILRSGSATLIISNEEMEDIMKIVKSLEDSRLLLKGASETIQNEAK